MNVPAACTHGTLGRAIKPFPIHEREKRCVKLDVVLPEYAVATNNAA